MIENLIQNLTAISLGMMFFFSFIIAILFLFLILILMPLINKFKDSNEGKKFKYAHGLSVFINFIQMIGLVYLII